MLGGSRSARNLTASLDGLCHLLPAALRVPDLGAGSAKAAGLGAGLLRKNENWHTPADPAGHPFDLCLFPAKQETTLMGVMLDCPDARELSTFDLRCVSSAEADGRTLSQ